MSEKIRDLPFGQWTVKMVGVEAPSCSRQIMDSPGGHVWTERRPPVVAYPTLPVESTT
ncbi:MAG: hypothetical protein RLZZ314_1115 [Bacteroidota bacterium]|jgi:hypothetical protein